MWALNISHLKNFSFLLFWWEKSQNCFYFIIMKLISIEGTGGYGVRICINSFIQSVITLLTASLLAPAPSKLWRHSLWPLIAETCNGVLPRCHKRPETTENTEKWYFYFPISIKYKRDNDRNNSKTLFPRNNKGGINKNNIFEETRRLGEQKKVKFNVNNRFNYCVNVENNSFLKTV